MCQIVVCVASLCIYIYIYIYIYMYIHIHTHMKGLQRQRAGGAVLQRQPERPAGGPGVVDVAVARGIQRKAHALGLGLLPRLARHLRPRSSISGRSPNVRIQGVLCLVL